MTDRAVNDKTIELFAIPIKDHRRVPGNSHARVEAPVSVPAPYAVLEAHQHVRELVRFILVLGVGSTGHGKGLGVACRCNSRSLSRTRSSNRK